TTSKYNNLNQLTSSIENKDGKETSNKTYTYDKNGNQTKEKDSITNVTVENTYDVDNRLSTSITVNGTNEVVNQENLYNGNGQRTQKKEGNNVVNYFYQDGVVSYTVDKDGNKTSQNFIGADGNIIGTTRYSNEGFKYYTYNKDIVGSTTSMVAQDGTSPVAYNYDDFGVTTTIGDKSFFNEFCYTGGIYDVSTGLYYLNARYYDPNNGRFITMDTYRGEINKPNTLHLYVYCANNSINYVDPSGHKNIKVVNNLKTGGPDKFKFYVYRKKNNKPYKKKYTRKIHCETWYRRKKTWYKKTSWKNGFTGGLYYNIKAAKDNIKNIKSALSPGVSVFSVFEAAGITIGAYTVVPGLNTLVAIFATLAVVISPLKAALNTVAYIENINEAQYNFNRI
ncbi:MAG: RHS repeat-associated core domain-containing protein, partial [Terrisporobacter sp.]|uniref:RHS repeat-associated core domain-containing protein n=1 Tax=Terrisporobacter sp. TaxID=1965305 RepID=UPI002FC9CC67